jgi:hypothetical protein
MKAKTPSPGASHLPVATIGEKRARNKQEYAATTSPHPPTCPSRGKWEGRATVAATSQATALNLDPLGQPTRLHRGLKNRRFTADLLPPLCKPRQHLWSVLAQRQPVTAQGKVRGRRGTLREPGVLEQAQVAPGVSRPRHVALDEPRPRTAGRPAKGQIGCVPLAEDIRARRQESLWAESAV